jgi:hypothetical protein
VIKCLPEVFPDAPFFHVDALPGFFSVVANDRVLGHWEEFVWMNERIQKQESEIRLTDVGELIVSASVAPGIHRMRYRMCLKSGTWCSGFAEVQIFVIGTSKKYKNKRDVPQLIESGMMGARKGDMLPRQG